jgi:hypothetical protein
MKTYEGVEYSSTIPDLGTRWSGQVYAPCHFIPKERTPCYPLDRRLGGPQSRSGRCGEEKKKIYCLHRESNLGRPDRSPELSWLVSSSSIPRLTGTALSWQNEINSKMLKEKENSQLYVLVCSVFLFSQLLFHFRVFNAI